MLPLGRTKSELRKAHRARVDLSAVVEIRAQSMVAIGQATKASFHVLLRDASSTGMSFVAPRPRGVRGPELLDRGARLTLRIPQSGRALEIPASVIWSVKSTEDGQPVAAGVRIHPEATDSATRRNWDLWIQALRQR